LWVLHALILPFSVNSTSCILGFLSFGNELSIALGDSHFNKKLEQLMKIIFPIILAFLIMTSAEANEVFSKEVFQSFVGKYEISNCSDHLLAFKDGTSINLAISPSYKMNGILFHFGGTIDDGNGYDFEDFDNHVTIDQQKMKHGCLASDDEWSINNNLFQAKTHTRWFGKYFCKLEDHSREEFTELQLMVIDANTLQVNYQQIIGSKTIQDGSCQLKRIN
jgi:hypothetical protein